MSANGGDGKEDDSSNAKVVTINITAHHERHHAAEEAAVDDNAQLQGEEEANTIDAPLQADNAPTDELHPPQQYPILHFPNLKL